MKQMPKKNENSTILWKLCERKFRTKKHSRKLFFFVCKVAEIQIVMWVTLEESYKTADLHGPEDKKKNTHLKIIEFINT